LSQFSFHQEEAKDATRLPGSLRLLSTALLLASWRSDVLRFYIIFPLEISFDFDIRCSRPFKIYRSRSTEFISAVRDQHTKFLWLFIKCYLKSRDPRNSKQFQESTKEPQTSGLLSPSISELSEIRQECQPSTLFSIGFLFLCHSMFSTINLSLLRLP